MNDKVVKSLIAIISFIVGGLVGIYKTTLDYQSELKVMEANIKLEIRRSADDTEQNIMRYIQNNILTKSVDNN